MSEPRSESFLQDGARHPGRSVRRLAVGAADPPPLPSFAGKRVGDFGCGFQASFARTIARRGRGRRAGRRRAGRRSQGRTRASAPSRGSLPGRARGAAVGVARRRDDVSVLEHVADAAEAARARCAACCARRHRAGQRPVVAGQDAIWSWRPSGWGWAPAVEMDDHKMYYDVRDLWPMLVAAGFRPSRIKCFSHKFGLNTFAVCQPA